jgi:MFS family permease
MERETTTRAEAREEAREEARREIARDTDRTAAAVAPAAVAPAAVASPLRWGPVWAGVLTAFGLFLLFSMIALAAGLTAVDFEDPLAGIDADLVAMIVTGLFIAVAFFAGGFVASWSAWLTEEGPAILHGFLVWALALVLLLVFVGLGLGQVFGAAGQVFADQFAPGQIDVQDPQALAEAFTQAAWQAVFAVVLAMAAAILGGLVAIREEVRSRDWSFGLYGRR